MVDYKKFAMVLGIMVLLPLFLGLFVDAVYTAPKYEDYCKNQGYLTVPAAKSGIPTPTNCTDIYSTPEAMNCSNQRGQPITKYDQNNCPVYNGCDMCSVQFNDAQSMYNRNIFFILAPIGLVVIVIGLFVSLDYMGAGLMLGGIITLFYATFRYFSDMNKLLRALVILVELLIIIYIGYKKIGQQKEATAREANASNASAARKKAAKRN